MIEATLKVLYENTVEVFFFFFSFKKNYSEHKVRFKTKSNQLGELCIRNLDIQAKVFMVKSFGDLPTTTRLGG